MVTLNEIVTRHGSFPGAEEAVAGLRAVLDLAEEGAERGAEGRAEGDAAVAEALATALDQVGNARAAVPGAEAARLVAWAERAAGDPAVPAVRVAFVLVNAGTAESLAALRRLAEAGRDGMRAVAADFVGDHPLA